MPKTSLVLTILGQDRPGLVDSLAQVVAEHGGSWVESRMAIRGIEGSRFEGSEWRR